MISIHNPKFSSPQFNCPHNVEGSGCRNFSDLHFVRLCYWSGCVQEHGSQNNEVRVSLLYSHLCLSNVSAKRPGKVWRNPWEPSGLRPLQSVGRNAQDWRTVAWCTSTGTTTEDTSGAPRLRSIRMSFTIYLIYLLCFIIFSDCLHQTRL